MNKGFETTRRSSKRKNPVTIKAIKNMIALGLISFYDGQAKIKQLEQDMK